MQLKQFLEEDDGVSPVIGVILMVAITVILAAVIASFVLGLGGDSEVQPNTSFDLDYDQVGDFSVEFTDDDELQGFLEDNTDYVQVAGGSGTQAVIDEWADEDAAGLLTIEVASGQSVEASELYLRGSGLIVPDNEGTWNEATEEDDLRVSDLGGVEADAEFSSAQGFTVVVTEDFDITLVWEATDSDESATLAERDGPEA